MNASGAMQMAIDTWLLEQHRRGLQPPTLRFYTWSTPTISLGYHQQRYPPAWNHLTWNGEAIALVRRPTGGRAVLHAGDLTYAIVTSHLRGSRAETYAAICQFLIDGMRSLHIDLHYGNAGRGYMQQANCFGTATAADLVQSDGSKLIGSAQLRRGTTILQHGSIRLDPDLQLEQHVFGTEACATTRLEVLSDMTLTQRFQRVSDALIEAAQACFGVSLIAQPLTPEEWRDIETFMQ